MIPKYDIEYTLSAGRPTLLNHYSTDDPVACAEIVEELLQRKFAIRGIKHEGLDLSPTDFESVIRTAAGMMASKHICASLSIKPEEEKFRFGFTA